jgi:hypothetical protein
MKKILFVLTVLFTTIFKLNAQAQEFNYNYGQVATTMEIYNYITKGFAIQVASGLDMKKGYFLSEKFTRSTNSSDGQRTVKVNSLVTESNFKVCGWMLIYQKSGSQPLYFCIPTQSSDQEVWNKSFTDLRDSKLSTDAYLAYTWALHNLVGQLSNDYDKICFSENTLISMSDGSQKLISDIKKGDQVLCFDNFTNQSIVSEVSELIVHNEIPYNISRITVNNENLLLASTENYFINSAFSLEATNNHPVVTKEGIKTIGELTLKDRLLFHDVNSNTFIDLPIIKKESNVKKVDKVFNIKLKNNINYIANNLVVLVK